MQNFFSTLQDVAVAVSKVLVIPLVFTLNLAGYDFKPQPQAPAIVETAPTLGGFNPSGGGTYRLGASIGSTDTSIRLSSFKEPGSNIPYTMAVLNSDIGYGTLGPQTSRREFISFTGVTQNVDGSATLTGVTRGLSPSYPFTASSSLRQAHAGQSIFILSDAPQVFFEYVTKRNNETITGVKTFASTSAPKYDFNPSFDLLASTTLASIGYVASTSFAGVVNASETVKGITELATNVEAAAGTSVGATGARLSLPNSLATSTCNGVMSGSVLTSSSTGKLSGPCFDASIPYTFSAANTFSATNTFSILPITTAATSTLANQLTTHGFVTSRTGPLAYATTSLNFSVGVGTTGQSATSTLVTEGGQSLNISYQATVSYQHPNSASGNKTVAIWVDNVNVSSYTFTEVDATGQRYIAGASINHITTPLSAGSHTVTYRFTYPVEDTATATVKGTGTIFTIK